MTQIKVVDLFCGCGGLSYGFQMEGYNVLLGVDNNKTSLETFKKNHIGSEILELDLTNLSNSGLSQYFNRDEIDVVVGGPPCQGFSLSGPRKIDDTRNSLLLSFIKLTKLIKPKSFVLENVPGLVGLFNGQAKEAVLNEFSDAGYKVSVQILNAADYGAPQIRKRVFFVGLRNSDREFKFPIPTHFNGESLFDKKLKEYVTCREAIGDLPGLVDDMGKDIQEYINEPSNEYQRLMRIDSEHICNHLATNHSEDVRKIISLVPEGKNYRSLPDEYRKTRKFNVAWTRFHGDKPAPTIDTGHRHHFHYKYNRVPTVRENARIQSFHDKFRFYGNKTEQYKQVGNAVPPLLAKAIAKELKKYL